MIENEVDKLNTTPSDYSIIISNFPKGSNPPGNYQYCI